MLTVPLTTITEPSRQSSLMRSAKDWMAERIANNVLMSRLDPSSSSESDEESDALRVASRRGSGESAECGAEGRGRSAAPDSLSRGSAQRRHQKARALQRGALFHPSLPAFRAVQAIETVKMRTDRNGSFRRVHLSRLARPPELTLPS